jgi:hypothetical protein
MRHIIDELIERHNEEDPNIIAGVIEQARHENRLYTTRNRHSDLTNEQLLQLIRDKLNRRRNGGGLGANWVPVGQKYMLNKKKLATKGMVEFRFRSNRHTIPGIAPFEASEGVKAAIFDLIDNKSHQKQKIGKLDPDEVTVVKRISGLFGVGSDDIEDTAEDRWKLIQGALLSTSRPSEELKNEARRYIKAALILKRISKQEHDLLHKELSL